MPRYNRNVATADVIHRTATRPTWADISLANLRHNFQAVHRHVGKNVTVCAVVKADAYGHGAIECARALQEEGAQWFGVTSLDEAIPLRESGIRSRILLMTGFWRGEEEELVHLNLTPTVWEHWQIERVDKAAARLGVSHQPVHLKVDTGMGRLGVSMAELPTICSVLKSAKNIFLEGFSTHLASSEVLDAPSSEEQLKRFGAAIRIVHEAGFDPPLIHAANTGAVISRRESWHNMVRPGIALYGYYLPFERAGREVSGAGLRLPVKPVLTWRTRILSLRDVPAHQALGYGGTYITKAPARIAVLPVGYADGLNRQLSSGGRVIVKQNYAPIVGRISMDLTLVDVTGLTGIAVGDEVILLGSVSAEEMEAEEKNKPGDYLSRELILSDPHMDGLNMDAREHAQLAHTNPYEILCNISKRVPRRYGR